MDEHYEVPGWVKGSAWELLSDERERINDRYGTRQQCFYRLSVGT